MVIPSHCPFKFIAFLLCKCLNAKRFIAFRNKKRFNSLIKEKEFFTRRLSHAISRSPIKFVVQMGGEKFINEMSLQLRVGKSFRCNSRHYPMAFAWLEGKRGKFR